MAHSEAPDGLLLVNPKSGRGRPDADELVREAERRGIATRLLEDGDDPGALARDSGAKTVGIAGGDGSLGPVAAAAIDRAVPFVCIPFGTRNHFARDVGLDRSDPVAALDAFVQGRERRIDVGRVGDRVFLNNVSFGVYARLVRRREAHRRRRDAFARLRALWVTLRNPHPERFLLNGEPTSARIVLVANNAYELDVLDLGARARLDEGRLHTYLAHGWLPRGWDEGACERVTVERAGGLRAAVDGEPVELGSRVDVHIEPRALRILVP